MLVIPMDSARPLLATGPAVPQIDRTTKEQALDRNTSAPLWDVPLVMPTDDGDPLPMRVTVPQTGITDEIAMGQMVKATGLTMVTDGKNGRAWYVFKAAALTVKKA